mgnify:FL=1
MTLTTESLSVIENQERFTDNRNEMEAKEYQNLAMRTNDGKGTERLEEWIREETGAEYKGDVMIENEIDAGGLLNGCLGLSGEAGELNDLVKKWIFHKKPLDREHMQKEIGDVCWDIADICHSMGFDLGEIFQMNIDKLKARYPEGFSEQRANNRSEGDI